MSELILMPDVEKALTGLLRAGLAERSEPYTDGVYVSNAVSNPVKKRMVIINRQGGAGVGSVVHDTAIVRVWVWAETQKEVNDLTNMVRALLPTLINQGQILQVVENAGPVTLAEETPQRLFTVKVKMRGSAI